MRVLVESPFRGDEERNVQFCRNVCRALVFEGHNPYASHLFFPQFLDDGIKEERDAGILLGLDWGDQASHVYFCLRPEEQMSEGMLYALDRHQMTGKICFLRHYTQEGQFLNEEAL